MIENYFFVSCMNPQYIKNKYTGENMVVCCGKCEACNNHKSSMSTLKVKIESLSHKYCRFITLTYSNDYIPRMQCSKCNYICDDGRHVYHFKDLKNDEDISSAFLYPWELERLYEKTGFYDELPYLRKKDLQLFIKRLRKHISKFSNEKIRYYAVGELGPVHYRPHFHLLLWFSDDKIAENISNLVCKAWQFGRLQCDIPKKVASYVAGYLNGSCHIPEVYRSRKCKPFCCHSFFLGEKFLQKSKKEVYEMSAKEFNERSISLDGTDKSVHVWRSLKAYYYPKSYAFATSDYDSLIRTYRIYKEVTDAIKVDYQFKPYVLAREITKFIDKRFYDIIYNINEYPPFIHYFLSRYAFDKERRDPLNYKRFERQVYFELKLSRHFLRNLCDNDSVEETKRLLNLIINYYKECDYENLKQQYDYQKQFVEFGYDIDEICYFYDNSFDSETKREKFKQIKSFRYFNESSMNVYNFNVKKKKLNDINKILYN